MRYRSYNSEILIATTLLIDVFNDIIIDRRKHGVKRDFSKAVSLNEIVQQKIEIPCILGDRSIILKSLENEPGKYKLPLIILQTKSLKTDPSRMVDLHNDVFYQEDDQFSKLDVNHHLYRPQQISKKRGQPIIIEYDMTIIAKYREDLDQIFSNWAVHFRPDVYVKWWHPRNTETPLVSQILWGHNLSYDAPIEYNPQNIFTYKFTTNFSFKSWLFYGMHSTENDFMDCGLIKKIKLFPNKTSEWDDNDLVSGEKDSSDLDDTYIFGDIKNENISDISGNIKNENILDIFDDIKNENISDLSFFGMELDQDFYDSKNEIEKLKDGIFIVENVFSEKNEIISGDQILSNVKNDPLVGDFFSYVNKYSVNESNKFTSYLSIEKQTTNMSTVKNVYFKGGFSYDCLSGVPPSGDFMFNTFYKDYKVSDEKIKSSDFGQHFTNNSNLNISYDTTLKNLIITSKYSDEKYYANFKNILNSSNGIVQEFEIFTNLKTSKIGMKLHKEYDKDLNEYSDRFKIEKFNVNIFNGVGPNNNILFKADLNDHKVTVFKILNLIKSLWNSINLREQKNEYNTIYNMEFEDFKFNNELTKKNLEDVKFRTLILSKEFTENDYIYQILCNDYIYIILKIDKFDSSNVDIYDIGPFVELSLQQKHEILYEIAIPESKMLLGLNFLMKY